MLHFYKILGDCYYYLDHWKEAEKVYYDAFLTFVKSHDESVKRNMIMESQDYFEQLKIAADLFATEKVSRVITKILTQIGNTKNKFGKFDEAIEAEKLNETLKKKIYEDDQADPDLIATVMNKTCYTIEKRIR